MDELLRRPPPLVIAVILTLSIFAPQPSWGQPSEGQFVHPFYVAADSLGSIFVTEPEKHRLQIFTNTGDLITKWGTLGSADGQFNFPHGIAPPPLSGVGF